MPTIPPKADARPRWRRRERRSWCNERRWWVALSRFLFGKWYCRGNRGPYHVFDVIIIGQNLRRCCFRVGLHSALVPFLESKTRTTLLTGPMGLGTQRYFDRFGKARKAGRTPWYSSLIAVLRRNEQDVSRI